MSSGAASRFIALAAAPSRAAVGLLTLTLVASACTSGHHHTPGPSGTAAPALAALAKPGACAAVTVTGRGKILTTQATGLGTSDPTRVVFDIGSAAKSVTAAAVLALVQAHRIELSSSISRYLHGVPAADRTITPGQLLAHTSGLPQDFSSDQARLTRDEAVRRILRLPRHGAGHFRYSNAGYVLLAAIVETVSRQPFRAFVTHRLLARAGMTATGWYAAPAGDVVAVHGHVRGRDTGPAGKQAPSSWATLGAGGMTSSATDMSRWLTAISSHKLLSAATTALMFAARVPLGQPGASAAYGWVVGRTPAGPVELVGGDTDYGYTSDLRVFPRQQLTTVALSCSSSTPAAGLGRALQQTYLR